MKTSWSSDYIYRKFVGARRANAWRREKELELKSKTGVHWVSEHAGGRINFYPTWKGRDPMDGFEPDEGVGRIIWDSIVPGLLRHTTFIGIYEQTNISLAWIVSVCKAWVRQGLLIPQVGRTGEIVAVTRKQRN